jgi:hypothetical protein
MSTREPVEFSALPFQLYAPSAADRQMKVYTSHLRDKVPFGKYTPPAPFGSASTSETMPQEGAHVAKKPRKEFVVRFDTPPTP